MISNSHDEGYVRDKPLSKGFYQLKFSYELAEDKGVLVVRPKVDSGYSSYNPLTEGSPPAKQLRRPNDKDKFWGPHIHLARVKTESDVLEFANKWGLLGLWNVEKYSKLDHLQDIGSTYGLLGNYSKWYRWELPPDLDVPYISLDPDTGEYKATGPRSFGSQITFQEPVAEFLEAAEEFRVWEKNLTYTEEQAELQTYDLPKACRPAISYNPTTGRWIIVWDLWSLHDAIYLRTAFERAEGGSKGFHYCKRCGEVFLRKHLKDEFCSRLCQSNYHSLKSKKAKIRGEKSKIKED